MDIREYNVATRHRKGADNMSEKEKEVLEKLKEVIPKMSEFDKGYILGKVENMAAEAKKN